MSWSVVAEVIGIVGQPTIVRLMPGLRPSRTGVLAFLFVVGGRRLRRSPRRFVRSLKLDHQLNQLVLAQALQISAIHAHMDSEIGLPGKGARKSGASSRSARRKWRRAITLQPNVVPEADFGGDERRALALLCIGQGRWG